ncbi:unnamed protein product [Lampetra planeri]
MQLGEHWTDTEQDHDTLTHLHANESSPVGESGTVCSEFQQTRELESMESDEICAHALQRYAHARAHTFAHVCIFAHI